MIKKHIKESISVKKKILENDIIINEIDKISKICIQAYKNGNKLLFAGNGGSAADSQHIAGEFVSRFYFDRPGLSAIALTTDTSILTAIGNDYGYDQLFSRQIEAVGCKGDIFFGISTSGNSKNIIEGLKKAKENKLITVGFSGESGGDMQNLCDYCINIPSSDTPRIQESHILVGHIICYIVEKKMFELDWKL